MENEDIWRRQEVGKDGNVHLDSRSENNTHLLVVYKTKKTKLK